MEEILASIRRIISEDGEAVEEYEAEEELVLDEPDEEFEELVEEEVMELEEEPEPEPEPEPVMELLEEEPEEEVFELTEVLEEEEPEEEVFELTEILEEEEPEPLVLEEMIEEEPEPEPEPVFEAVPEYEPEPIAEPDPYVSGPAAMPGPESEGLVSREAAEQTAAAFVDFASAVSSAQGVQLGASHRTLEELVKESLRPMLKVWLDNNLQPIVSRTVEREIAKLAGRADED
ncbi:MAG: hypothetical protein CL569_12515 [Alphaproteobacteria bacterium]|nr:hypothetical protein [Alphaproteobacteria bacterium]|tara:strand:+ start:4687 stop:5382 length:696 start_codon:yes stop_codon:yes gene_type:complete